MKRIYLLAILALLSWNLYSQINWVKDCQNNPVMFMEPGTWEDPFISPSSVLLIENTYHLWYFAGQFPALGGDLRIGHATSPDGIDWTKDVDHILELGTDGEWDDKGVAAPSVIFTDTIYHMWYSGYTSDDIFSGIGHATSKDAITWKKDPNNPVLESGASPEWDLAKAASPTVVYDGSEFHMWYGGSTYSSFVNIGHATSADGSTWTKDPQNPVLEIGGSNEWDYPQVDYPEVVFYNDTFHMFYVGGAFLEWNKGYATSADGSTWTKSQTNPVLKKGSQGKWDDKYVSASAVMIDSDNKLFKIWYAAASSNSVRAVGFATSVIGAPPSESDTCIVSVESSSTSETTSIFPNPARDMITVKTNTTGKHTLEIVSMNGQLLYSHEKSIPNYNMDLSLYEKGIYFVTIRSQYSVKTEKVIIL